MKIIAYLKWVWKGISMGSRLYIGNLILLVAAFFFPYPYDFAAFSVVMLNMCIFLFCMIRESLLNSYGRFKQEQNKLLEILKNSEQK